jgi:flagellar secretion chaperone FliS
MSPHFSYQRSAAASWSRIDLLLTVYDVGIQTATAALEAVAAGDSDGAVRHRLKFYRVLMQILDGLDARYETTQNIQRLALFMFDRSTRGTAADWRSVLTILHTLREGFAAVREEALELEARGLVPAVSEAAAVNLSV